MSLNVGGYTISIDANDPLANVSFVSHAHSDHTSGIRKGKKALASQITKELVEARTSAKVETIEVPSSVQLLNAGHMLGSKQLYISDEEHGCSILYSGDYQMQESCVAEKIETKRADILVLDSTYPYVNIEFDERSETETVIQKYIKSKRCVVFGAYVMGKSQELIKICNEMGIEPLVDGKIASISEVYGRFGVNLSYKAYGSEQDLVNSDAQVVITGTSKLTNTKETLRANGRPAFSAVATGFARLAKFNTDVQFALSDHADFKQATEYIGLVNPQIIYTCGQGSQSLAKNLRAVGYTAFPIGSISNINDSIINVYKALTK